MNAGGEVLRKMLLAASVLAACSWLAPKILAQSGTSRTAAVPEQQASVKADPSPSSHPTGKELSKLGRMPMYFEENRGQTDSRVKFLSRGRGYTLFLTEDEAVLALEKKGRQEVQRSGGPKVSKSRNTTVLRMKLSGANPVHISGEVQLPGKIFYARGKEKGPLSGNATYQRVKYAEAYPGIDLMYYGNEKQLEFDFVVAPHADPHRIRLSFSGAEKIKLTKHGELSLRVSDEEVRLKKPVIYQERNGRRTEIAGGYVLAGKGKREAIFELAPYDPSLPLVIDPQIDFATYLGGTGLDQINVVRVSPTGEVYVLGQTDPSTGFPTTQTIPPPGLYQSDCFVSKLSADGSTLLYSVIFPGTYGNSMAVDLFGKVHLSLFEWGVGSFLRTLAQDSTGTLSVTPLQGAFDFNSGSAEQMQVDSQGNVYMVIFYYPTSTGPIEYGLFKVDANGQLMGTLTLLVPGLVPLTGGGQFQIDQITGLAVDDAGHAFVIGNAGSTGTIAPTPNAFQPVQQNTCLPSCSSWDGDGFILEVDTNTANNFAISYASYLGGSSSDYLAGIAVGHDGALYITGESNSADFPTTPGAYATQYTLGGRGFVVKLDLTRSGPQQLVFGTFLPVGHFNADSIVVLPGGLPAIFGNQSYLLLEVNPLFAVGQRGWGGPGIVVFSNDGSSVVFASYLQPDAPMYGWYHMTSNGSGKLYVGGYTNDPRLGLQAAYQPALAGDYDGLVRAISGIAANRPPTVDLGSPITVSQPLFSLDCGNTLFCNISDPDGNPLISYRWLGPNGFTVTSTSSPPVASVQLHAGSNQISLIVTDDQGAVGSGTLTVTVTDTDPPIVLPPPDLQDHSTEPSGARGSASFALHAFLFATATATDLLDPHPVMLPPQADFGAGPVDVDDQTLFPLGSTLITFRFQDSSGNVGVAAASVTVTSNQAPSMSLSYFPFVSPVIATSPAGASVTVYAYALDPENDPLSLVWSGSTTGLSLFQAGNGIEQMSGVLPIGVHLISVTVTDGHGGSATASTTITVSGINTTGSQTVFLFDDNRQQANFSSYWLGNPLGGHLINLNFSNVQTPGLSYFSSRSDLVPPPPTGTQAGSPPYYYDIGTTAGYSGNIDVCVNIAGMSFANPQAAQLYLLQGASWTALTSALTSSTQLCGSTSSLGTFAIFYPEVPETAIATIGGTGILANSIDGAGGDPRDDDVASGPATSVPLSWPRMGTFDRARNYLYFSDGLFRVRRLDLNTGDLTIVFGNGFFVDGIDGPGGNPQDDFVEGADPLVSPGQPIAIAVDAAGNLYYRDANTCQVRKVDFTANTVNTVAGNGTCTFSVGFSGDGGPALQASLSSAFGGLAVDGFGNLFLAEEDSYRILRVDAVTGIITTVAGNGGANFPTPGVAATLSSVGQPWALAFDAQGYLLVASHFHSVVRISPGADLQIKGDTDEILSIAVGDPQSSNLLPFNGDGGTATQAFVQATHVAVASDGALILTETGATQIRRVSPGADGIVTGAPDEMITTIAGYRYVDPVGFGIFNGDTFATMATLAYPQSAVEDAQGRIIVIDTNNNRIRRFGLSPFLRSGSINWPPLADAQSVSTDFDTAVSIDLTGSDPNNDPLTFTVVSQPANGQLSGSAPNLTYTPNAGFQGTDSFTFKVNDGNSDSNVATVTITVQLHQAELSLTATASPDPVNTSSNLTYSITVVNNGPSDATGVIVDYPSTNGVNFVSAVSSQGTCTTPAVDSSGAVSCDLGTLAASASATVTIVTTPTTAGPLASVLTLGGNEPDPNRLNNTATVNVTVTLAPAVINIIEQIVVTDSPALLPSALIGVNENITVTDVPVPLPSAMIGVNENITVTDAPAPLPSAIIGVNENIAVTDAPVVLPPDTTPPAVTPPASIVVAATETSGARGNVSAALQTFLLGGTATDAVDPSPQRLPPQVNGSNADDTTLFPVGATTVTFRFRDASNNIGTATTLVIVDPPIGGAVNSGGVPVTPTDTFGTPMSMEITFTGVTQPGLVTATPIIPPPASPTGFQISGTVFDIVTTAIFTPPIEVCFIGSGFTARDRILHFARGFWVDVTSLVTSTKICGTVNSLSPFAVATLTNSTPSANAGANQTVEATSALGASVSLSGSGSDPDGDTLAFSWSGPCGGASNATAVVTCPLGTSTMTLTVDDGHGGQSSASVTLTVRDTTPPALTGSRSPQPNAAGWNNSDVVVTFTCTDAVGIGTPPVSPQTLSAEGVGQTASATCTDTSGNTSSATVSGIMIDKTPPAITLNTPTNGAVYLLNQNVAASYSCSDALSGLSSCTGAVANGAKIDTSAVGSKLFTVNASDEAGNSAQRQVSYSVRYSFIGFFSPIDNLPVTNLVKAGRTIPIKWRLTNAGGTLIGDLGTFVSLTSAPLACDASPTDAIEEVLTPTGGTQLRWDATTGQFIFDWKTSSSWQGCRMLQLTLSDGTKHFAKFQFK